MEDNVASKVVKGMAWTGIERFLTLLIQFIIGIIIARRLMPSDYGIIGMLTIFIALAQTFLDSGFGNALIQKKNRTEEDFSTVFFFNIIISIAIYGLLYISAPYIAKFYNTPILVNVTRVISLSIIFAGLSIVQQAKLTIDLNFRIQALTSIVAVIVSGICGIIMAYNGFGVWALVYQNLINSIIRTLILWSLTNWRPISRFSINAFKTLFAFGSKLLCSSIINTIYSNINTIVIGKIFNASEVGLYNRAIQFASLPSGTITEMVIKVNFPVLSQMQDDNKKLLDVYTKLLCIPLFVLYPILFSLAILANPIIELLLGPKWLPCVPYLQILCIGYLFYPLTHINLNLLYVKGRSDLVLKLELIKKPIAFIILFITVHLGIWWICFGNTVYSIVAFAINCYYTNKILDYGFIKQIQVLLPIFAYNIVMAISIICITILFNEIWQQLILGFCTAVSVYLLCAYIGKDDTLQYIINLIESKLKIKRFVD